MKQMKYRVLAVMLLICILLAGCDIPNIRIYTDGGLRRTAEKTLEETYGEEFIIHKVWSKNSRVFYATCSPERDTDIVFESEIMCDGSGLYVSGYAEGIVSKQITDYLQPELEQFFPECYIHTMLWNPSEEYNSEDMKSLTIEKYLNEVENVHNIAYIVVDAEQLSENTIEAEYDFWNKILQDKIGEGECSKLAISIYYSNNEMTSWCDDYFDTRYNTENSFYTNLKDCYNFGFAYPEGKINLTYEEYENLRRGNLKDE